MDLRSVHDCKHNFILNGTANWKSSEFRPPYKSNCNWILFLLWQLINFHPCPLNCKRNSDTLFWTVDHQHSSWLKCYSGTDRSIFSTWREFQRKSNFVWNKYRYSGRISHNCPDVFLSMVRRRCIIGHLSVRLMVFWNIPNHAVCNWKITTDKSISLYADYGLGNFLIRWKRNLNRILSTGMDSSEIQTKPFSWFLLEICSYTMMYFSSHWKHYEMGWKESGHHLVK